MFFLEYALFWHVPFLEVAPNMYLECTLFSCALKFQLILHGTRNFTISFTTPFSYIVMAALHTRIAAAATPRAAKRSYVRYRARYSQSSVVVLHTLDLYWSIV